MKKNRYRHELKFAIKHSEYLAIRSRLKQIMKTDSHTGPEGLYYIRSIYFDNQDDKALKEKVNGVSKREKFRIRYYNDDLSYITLEKKMKINDLCLKCDAKITEEECRKILAGDTAFMKEHPQELVRELYAKMNYQGLRPRVLVSYIREPFIYSAGNVRITFDTNVRTTHFQREFLKDEVSDISATDRPHDIFLEVKFDAFLPGVIQDIIQTPGVRQQSFSKYCACRRFG